MQDSLKRLAEAKIPPDMLLRKSLHLRTILQRSHLENQIRVKLIRQGQPD